MPDWRSRARLLGWPLRRALNPRFAAVTAQVDLATAAAHAEGSAGRQATQAISATIEQHAEALLEMADHFSARLDLALASLERIEARITEHDAGTAAPARPVDS